MLDDLIEKLIGIRDTHGNVKAYAWDCYNDCESDAVAAIFSHGTITGPRVEIGAI